MNLYELIQEEHEKLRKKNIQVSDTPAYSIALPAITQGEKTINIRARYNNSSQQLLLVDVVLKDSRPKQTFTDKEIEQLVNFVSNPKYLVIEDSDDLKKFCLSFRRKKLLTVVNWHSKERFCQEGSILKKIDGEFQPVTYNELAKMFGINLNGRQFLHKYRFRNIDTSNTADAYLWLVDKFFSPKITVFGKKRGIFIEAEVPPKTSKNRFEIQTGLSGPVNSNYELSKEECKTVEQIVNSYRI